MKRVAQFAASRCLFALEGGRAAAVGLPQQGPVVSQAEAAP